MPGRKVTWDAVNPPNCPGCNALMAPGGKGVWQCDCGRKMLDTTARKIADITMGATKIKVQRPVGNGRTKTVTIEVFAAKDALKAAQAGFDVRRESWTEGVTITRATDNVLRFHSEGKPCQVALRSDFMGDDWEILD